MAEGSDKIWKARVFDGLKALFASRAADAERELESIATAYEGETKSSAGDKYETAREMLSQARAMQLRLREEAQVALDWLDRQERDVLREKVLVGALARLDDGWILVCPFALQLEVDGVGVRCLSLASPLGQALKGAKAGEVRDFRGRSVEVREVA